MTPKKYEDFVIYLPDVFGDTDSSDRSRAKSDEEDLKTLHVSQFASSSTWAGIEIQTHDDICDQAIHRPEDAQVVLIPILTGTVHVLEMSRCLEVYQKLHMLAGFSHRRPARFAPSC